MSMTLSEFNTFKKMMEMTTSSVDAEALNALRRANAVLTTRSLTWTQVLDRVIKVELPIEANDDNNSDILEELFKSALSNARGSFRDTIESIHERWENTGFITPRQREVLENAAKSNDSPKFRR